MTDQELRQLYVTKGGGAFHPRRQFLTFDADMSYEVAKALYAEGRVVIVSDRQRKPAGWAPVRSIRETR